ncbi:hypothetical protein [Sedimentibacter sp. MB31-C6]|uniref:hypothetical protein n=1 Tax=Sedimentibacter sp. MB31-C6 TaxID=3109366 RepID=UPI002DDCA309|nr:hypothetical protein [Sedimentibacter sp. MB36-C1]WSI04466.1 hypothetical protein U8307_01410 [Sedimentibacter sp. MB36-C1]
MEFLSLKILDKFQKVFEICGIDYEIMRMILNTKLTLDNRRAPVIANQNKKNESEQTSLIKRYLMHLLFGLMLAFFIYFIEDEMIRMTYFSGAFFFMTTMYLISDFSFVLLDTKDKNILLTKPINSKVVSLSKVLHILIYMFRLNAFIAGPSLVAIVMTNGLLAIPIFLIEILLMDLLIFLLTAFIYLLILRFFDGELLRNIINLIQILLTILVTIGYQIAIRMIDFSTLENIAYKFEIHNYFNPILWFGAPFEIIFNKGREIHFFVFTVLLIAVPLICFIIYLKLSKKMESLLLKLESEGREKPSKHRIEVLIGKLINRNETVKQSYHFTNAVLRSDRSLKLKVYPSLSMGILLPVLMIFNMGMRGSGYEASGFESFFLYFNFIAFPPVLDLVQYSTAWKGSFVYAISGFDNIKELYKGVLKSIATRLLIPLLIFNGIIYIVLFKEKFIIDIITIMLVSIVILPIIGKIYFTEFPFSLPINESNQSKSIDKYFMSLGVAACFLILHIISHKIPMGNWIYIGMLIICIPLSWKFAVPKRLFIKK